MLKDVLSEFEGLCAVNAFWRDAFPKSVKLEFFVVKWPFVIHAEHLFSDLATLNLFLTVLHGPGNHHM